MATSARFLPARSRLVTAALLAAPPPNPWLASPSRACTRHLLIPCQASKYNRDRSFDSSRKQGDGSSKRKGTSSSSRHTTSSSGSSTSRAGQQQPRDAALHSPQQQQQQQRSNSKHPGTPDGSSSRSSSSRAKEPAVPVSIPLPPHAPVLVVGAGAAGLTAAYFAAKQGAEVGGGLGCSVCGRWDRHRARLQLSCCACWAVPAGSRLLQCCLPPVLVCTHMCLQVVVLERTREAGKKVLMSGGTRCNILPLEADLSVGSLLASCLQLHPVEELSHACLAAACGMLSHACLLAWECCSEHARSIDCPCSRSLGSQIPCV